MSKSDLPASSTEELISELLELCSRITEQPTGFDVPADVTRLAHEGGSSAYVDALRADRVEIVPFRHGEHVRLPVLLTLDCHDSARRFAELFNELSKEWRRAESPP